MSEVVNLECIPERTDYLRRKVRNIKADIETVFKGCNTDDEQAAEYIGCLEDVAKEKIREDLRKLEDFCNLFHNDVAVISDMINHEDQITDVLFDLGQLYIEYEDDQEGTPE